MSTEIQNLTDSPGYRNLLEQISDTYSQGRTRAVQAVNKGITATYWRVGKHIVECEQDGKSKAEYGKALISNLSRDLGLRHGRGFSRANVIYMRLFYQCFPDAQTSQTLSDQLSWSHIVELLKIDDPLVEYATYGMNSQLFVQKYQLYLPDREALRHELELSLREAEQ